MEFIILVTLWYMLVWFKHNGMYLSKSLGTQGKTGVFILWGYFSSALKGLTYSYTLWFIYFVGKILYEQYSTMGI